MSPTGSGPGKGALVPWSALLCISRLPSDVPAAAIAPKAFAAYRDNLVAYRS